MSVKIALIICLVSGFFLGLCFMSAVEDTKTYAVVRITNDGMIAGVDGQARLDIVHISYAECMHSGGKFIEPDLCEGVDK